MPQCCVSISSTEKHNICFLQLYFDSISSSLMSHFHYWAYPWILLFYSFADAFYAPRLLSHKTQTRPTLEYCSNIFSGVSCTAPSWVQRKVARLISDSELRSPVTCLSPGLCLFVSILSLLVCYTFIRTCYGRSPSRGVLSRRLVILVKSSYTHRKGSLSRAIILDASGPESPLWCKYHLCDCHDATCRSKTVHPSHTFV